MSLVAVDSPRETRMDNKIVEQHPSCSPGCLIPCGNSLCIKVIGNDENFLKPPFERSSKRNSRHTVSDGDVDVIFTNLLSC